MDERRRILITGAMGRVGRALTSGLAETYTLRLHDLKPDMAPDGFDFAAADITSFEAVRPLMTDIDTVVHLAGNPSVEADWESILNANIIGTRNILEAARQSGVRRVVFASSNHAMGMYDRDGEWPVYHTMPVRPDSLYGTSKAMGEVLGRHYHDAFGLDFIALDRVVRRGTSQCDEPASTPGDVARPKRYYQRRAWGDRDRGDVRHLLRGVEQP